LERVESRKLWEILDQGGLEESGASGKDRSRERSSNSALLR